MIGGDIYVVNAEYAWRDHSWYATLSFSFFFFLLSRLLSLPSSLFCLFLPFLISYSSLILTLCRAAHLLQVDFVEMYGQCTVRYLGGIPHVMCDEPYAGPVCKTFFKISQSWLLFRSGMPPSSPPHLPLNLSLFILFLPLSDH